MTNKGISVKRDGNGGFDVNVQKAVLRRWGPPGLAILLVLTGLGSKMGEEAWAVLTDRERLTQEVGDNKAAIEKNAVECDELRREIQGDLSEIRASIMRMETLILDHVVRDDEQGGP